MTCLEKGLVDSKSPRSFHEFFSSVIVVLEKESTESLTCVPLHPYSTLCCMDSPVHREMAEFTIAAMSLTG